MLILRLPRLGLRGAVAVVLLGSSAACSKAPPPVQPSAGVSPRETFVRALAHARAARDAAYAVRAPGTSALSAMHGQEGRIDESLAGWAKARGEATQRADTAYSDAIDVAPSTDDELVARAELAELWFSVIDEAEAAVLSATPEAVRFDGTLQASLRSTAAESFAPVRARVARNLDHCVRLAGDDMGPGSYFQRCQDIALRLTAGSVLTPPEIPSGDGAPRPTTEVRVAGSDRPVEPTTRPRPCSFRGTVAVNGRLFASETGDGPSTELREAEPIEVDSLDVPKAPGGRYKVTVRWPKAQDGYLETAEGILALRRRVDIVPDYVWAPEGLRVVASDARGPTVHITKPGPKPPPTKGGPPLLLDRRLFCYDLTLVSALTRSPFEFTATGNPVSLRGDAPVPLLGKPGGKVIARLPTDAKARIVEAKGGYTRIIGSQPLLFEGWVKSTSLGLAAPQ